MYARIKRLLRASNNFGAHTYAYIYSYHWTKLDLVGRFRIYVYIYYILYDNNDNNIIRYNIFVLFNY